MKRLTVALLVISVFAPAIFAQSAKQKHRLRVFSGWLDIVRGAERDYKNKNGRYGDLAALRKAHLLGSLVFESDSSAAASRKAHANFVPKRTLFQVTVSEDGQHFTAVIRNVERCGVSTEADDISVTASWDCCNCPPGPELRYLPDLEDSPEGLIFAG